ncbi:MAG: class I SAM-dependent methyltransferase [Stellaceae bacterium]
MEAAQAYAARIDAVLAQRTRLRGTAPGGDLFGGIPADHPLLGTDPRRPRDANLQALASLIERDDVIVDIGGGSGRLSLPFAADCREIVNVEPSAAMGRGFLANAARAGIANIRLIEGDWLEVAPPVGTLALACHVTYFMREIVASLEKMQRAGPRRAIILVNEPPPPSWNRVLFELVHGEAEEIVPGRTELVAVLREMGIAPELRVLSPTPAARIAPAATRQAAIDAAVARFNGDQWTFWPLGAALDARLRGILDARFDALFLQKPDGFVPGWIEPGNEVLIAWRPAR